MAENVGYATLDVIPSLRGFEREMTRQGRPALTAAGRTGGKQYGDALGTSATSTFRTHLKSLSAIAGGAAVGRGIFEFFQGSITGASDLAETTSKLKVIFGAAADEVEAFSQDSTRNILLTEQAASDAAATFGTFGKSAGLTGSDLASFSTDLAALASDLSSFNNTTTDDAITALGSALRGESEPIRRYGVLLDDATLRQEAMRIGLVKTTKEALTPAQKVQAAYSEILKQTADAQGDAARTQDGYANSVRILRKRFQELQTEAGEKILPTLTNIVGFLNDKGIPALEATGGAVADAVGFFRSLPAPVQAATGALIAFKAAQRFGITDGIGRGATATMSGLSAVRGRLSEVAGTWREYRTAQLVAVNQGHKFTNSSGRIVSGLAAIRTGARGAGGALKASLGGALGLVGGPWGVAFIGATAVLTHFWQENQESKQRVDDLTASLKQQTGEITKQTKVQQFKNLQDSGAIDLANELGVSLTTLRDASLGNADAQKRLNAQLVAGQEAAANNANAGRSAAALAVDYGNKADRLRGNIGGANDELERSVQAWKDQKEFMGPSNRETERGARAFDIYSHRIDETRDALKKLMAAEQKRHDQIISRRRDEIALREAVRAAREEANKGKEVLEGGTKAADDNMSALLDLAEQWNNSKASVRNAKGAYENIRKTFIDLADQMNGPDGTRADAKKLADELLNVPKNVPVKFKPEGYEELVAKIERLQRIASRQVLHFQFSGSESTGGSSQPPNHSPGSSTGGKAGGSAGRVIAVSQTFNVNTIGDANRAALHHSRQISAGGFG